MAYKTKGEKLALKKLRDVLRSRQINGARLAQGKKSAKDLEGLEMAPAVYVFKNLFSGQVMYSQVPVFHQDQIDEQFTAPNWQNRKPSRRGDLWRIMCVAEFANYDYAVAAYDGLVQLKQLRNSKAGQKEASEYREKNHEGNVWSAGQYRPVYAQEAVADIAHVIEEFELEGTRLQWENLWRKGHDSHWNQLDVEHAVLPAHSPKHQTVLLDELREKAVEEFRRLREQSKQEQVDSLEAIVA